MTNITHRGTAAIEKGPSTPIGDQEGTRHSKEDAITDRQFEQLLRATYNLDDRYSFEARFIVHTAAKLGLRAGEIAHFSTDWINWSARTIEIPEHSNCEKGNNNNVCGYCREMAERHLRAHNFTVEGAKEAVRQEYDVELPEVKVDSMAREVCDEHNKTYREAIKERWEPKTENSARSVPFDWDTRTEMCIEEAADHWEEFPRSRCTVNRRVNRAATAAGIKDTVYPHALRSTSASYHASRDVSPYALMAVMGWNDIQTARSYIQASDETAAKEIRSKHR